MDPACGGAGQIGGSFGAAVTAWGGFAPLFVTAARWLVGQEEPSDLFATVRREGSEAVLLVEVDRSSSIPPDATGLLARLRHPDGEYAEYRFERTGEDRYEARVALRGSGVTLGTLRLPDGRFENLPPIVLPYSPEFEHALDHAAGERLLRELARRSGGQVAPPAHTLFRGDRSSLANQVLSRELALAALLVFLLEIAARRLGLWSMLSSRARREEPRGQDIPRSKRLRRRARAPEPDPSTGPTTPGDRHTATRPHSPGTVGTPGGVSSALDRARRSARRKLDRG